MRDDLKARDGVSLLVAGFVILVLALIVQLLSGCGSSQHIYGPPGEAAERAEAADDAYAQQLLAKPPAELTETEMEYLQLYTLRQQAKAQDGIQGTLGASLMLVGASLSVTFLLLLLSQSGDSPQ